MRHGDKEKGDFFNERLRHQDNPLSEAGRERAKRLCGFFEHRPISKIIASEYLRTEQTASYIAEKKGLKITRDGRLNEIDNGLIDSMGIDEISEKFPEFYREYFSFSKDVRFPGGENGEEVFARQKSLLEDILREGEDVLLISHDGFMRTLACFLLELPPYKRCLFKADLCGIMEAAYDEDLKAWRIIRFNQTSEC